MSRHAYNRQILVSIADLAAMGRPELVQRWQDELGGPAPPLKRELLMRVLASKLQTKEFGDVSAMARAELATATRRARKARRRSSNIGAPPAPPPSLSSGTRLIKVWRGKTYVVDVLDDGFAWNGRHYPSLSAAAKAITGSHWNGMIFFGLRHRSSYGANTPDATSRPMGADHG